MKNIVIMGWFGCGNYGDNFILQSQIKLISEIIPDSRITVLCGDSSELISNLPDDVIYKKMLPVAFYRLYKFLDIRYFISSCMTIKSCDILVLGGGGFFSDRQKFAVLGWLRWCKIFHFFGAKVVGFGMGMGPFFHNFTKKNIKKHQKYFSEISLRDDASIKYLLSTGFNKGKIYRVIDPAFYTFQMSCKKYNKIGFILQEGSSEIISEITKILQNTDYLVELIITDTLDVENNMKIMNSIQSSRLSFFHTSQLSKISIEIASCEFIFSQRLHGSIIAFTQKTPFVNMYYHHKGKELGKFLKLGKFSIDMNSSARGDFIDFIKKKDTFEFASIDLVHYKNVYRGVLNEKS